MENKNKSPRWLAHGAVFGIEILIYIAVSLSLLFLFLFMFLVMLYGIINNPELLKIIIFNPIYLMFFVVGLFAGIFLIIIKTPIPHLIKSPLREWPEEGIIKRYEKEALNGKSVK